MAAAVAAPATLGGGASVHGRRIETMPAGRSNGLYHGDPSTRPRWLAQAAARLARPLALVPTMGALHAGHLALVAQARRDNAAVMATIFVNPLQFGPTEDFSRYPRAFADDARQLEAAGVDVLFAPSVEEMYPPGFDTSVDPGAIATRFEGALRPGHFRGVATVCVKLFAIARAERVYFGAKDAQQVAVMRQVVRDLALATEIVVVPTMRDADMLAPRAAPRICASPTAPPRRRCIARCMRWPTR